MSLNEMKSFTLGSSTYNSFVDETARGKIDKMVAYVTPETFGAKGDGVTDDYEALQNCINYAITNRVTVCFKQDYYVSKSIIIEGTHAYITNRGIRIDGNNKRLFITNNVPALIIRGNGHTIENLIVTFPYTLYDEATQKQLYTSSLVQIQAVAGNTCFLCNKNKFINVTCRCNNDYRNNSVLYTSIGFEFVIQGNNTQNSYAYENSFVSCNVRNLGTAIKITENEYSEGCNGNSFDIVGWGVDCYLDGVAGGSVFNGVVQSTAVLKTDENGDVVNRYLVKNIGDYNIFENTFYDYNDSLEKNKPMVYDGSGKYNRFTQNISDRGIEPNIYNEYVSVARFAGRAIMPINLAKEPMLVTTIMPMHNSFNLIKEATIKADGLRVLDRDWGWDLTKYPEFSNGLPTNVAPVFHDDSNGRRAGFFQNQTDTPKTVEIEFVPLGYIDAMFMYFYGYQTLENISLVLEFPTAETVTHKFDIFNGLNGVVATFSNVFYMTLEEPTKATIKIEFPANSQSLYLCQIAGYMHSSDKGVI